MRIPVLRKFWWAFVLGFLSLSSPAFAFNDCPLVGTLENFDASQPPRIITYNAEEFQIVEGNESKTVTKTGKVCRQDYSLKSGIKAFSGLEIMQNYAEGLPAQGFKITNTKRAADDDVYATIRKGSTEYWVKVWESNGDGLHVLVLEVTPFHPNLTAAGDGDCPFIPVQQNFQSSGRPYARTYDVEEFTVTDGVENKTVKKYGKVCKQDYSLKPGIGTMSGLEIMRNYVEAAKSVGFSITNSHRNDDDDIFATMTKDGSEYWFKIWESNGDGLHILVLAVAPFRAHLIASGDGDCPFIPVQQNFQSSGRPYARTYDVEEFTITDGNENKAVKKYGKVCKQDYSLKPGIGTMSGLEIMRNYAEAAKSVGFSITNSHRNDDDDIFATMTRDGSEYWFKIWESNGDGLHILALQVAPFHSTLAAASPKDCPIVPSLQSFEASQPPRARKFDSMEFQIVEGDQNKTVTKKGKICQQDYSLKPGVGAMSGLEIMLNYAEALPALGMAITNTHRAVDDDIFAEMTKDGVESWAKVWESNGDGLHVAVLQIEPFHSSMKPPKAGDDAAAPPAKTKLKVTAIRAGQALGLAWCGLFPPGGSPAEPVSRAKSGETQTAPPAAYDVGCFLDEGGKTTSGWLRNQAVAAGPAEVTIELPAMKPAVGELRLPAPAAVAEKIDPEQDFPYLPALPGSKLTSGKTVSEPFYVQPADAKQPELVANGSMVKQYELPAGVSVAQLLNAYRSALLKAQWTIVSERRDEGVVLTGHYGLNGRNIWATLRLGGTTYVIAVADATLAEAKLEANLSAQCHLALTGVLFDFNKSKLKPESDPVLEQVSAVMTRTPDLRLEVQGHTDGVGSEHYNLPLSKARARAVVVWLTDHGVAAERLEARGYGKTKPIASNDTDEGRAKNRRVEIANPTCTASDP